MEMLSTAVILQSNLQTMENIQAKACPWKTLQQADEFYSLLFASASDLFQQTNS